MMVNDVILATTLLLISEVANAQPATICSSPAAVTQIVIIAQKKIELFAATAQAQVKNGANAPKIPYQQLPVSLDDVTLTERDSAQSSVTLFRRYLVAMETAFGICRAATTAAETETRS